METNSNHWLIPHEELEDSPSRRDDISFEDEKMYRLKTSLFIESIGKFLSWLLVLICKS